MNSLVEQVREKLREKVEKSYDNDALWSHALGQAEMICKLVGLLEDIKNNDCFMPECTCRRDTAAIGLHELRKDLGLGE